MADLFGVSVDQLVRDGEALKPEAPKPEVTERVIYVKQRLAKTQILGVVLLVTGLFSVILGAAVSGNSGTYMAMAGAGMVVLGLPFLLARKHPFLITGWVVLAVSCLILNPYTSVSPWGLGGGTYNLYLYFTRPELHYATCLFAAIVGIGRGLWFLVLVVYTGWLGWKRWKGRKENTGG